MTLEFQPFPKIARLNRECTITEKIDGTNAQVTIIRADGPLAMPIDQQISVKDGFVILAGSRSRWLAPTKSNDDFGFAGWVRDNADDLLKLGEGSHFGEWWGSGIQRGYGLEKGEKRFSLFNAERWSDPAVRPACCHVVPVLYRGAFSTMASEHHVDSLRINGSSAAPGFMNAEGVIVWHVAARLMFKVTLEKDSEPKGLAA